MPLDLKEHLKQLSQIAAPSGREEAMGAFLRTAWADLVDSFETDGLGSLIALKRGSGPEPRPRLMVCTHMDEVGLIVSQIRQGFILTHTLGTADYRVLLGQPVIVHGRRPLPGVFGAAPPHMTVDRKKYPSWDELWIDVGLPADEVAALVQIGDMITFDSPPLELKNHRIAAKSLDNRASVAALTACLDELTHRQHAWDVYAVASVLEERGGQGAVTATNRIRPDLAITLDVTFGTQPGVRDDDGFALNSGPTIGRGPNFPSWLEQALHQVARDEEIKTQIEPLPGSSGTDAWHIQVSHEGVPTLLISIPVRNMHTPVEVVDLRDVQRAARLLTAFISGLAPGFLATTAPSLPGGDA
jgi:putative aminopeptidase FrvX